MSQDYIFSYQEISIFITALFLENRLHLFYISAIIRKEMRHNMNFQDLIQDEALLAMIY